eukprot:TRINITY_DN31865_c0_g1_i1.p1 TRINITY_DN31865_c0_g1~~TRINITY_DN31865_c0_g1_i1.p1  ORF type:complete len:106 (+),score=3.30 TRINITY_DN31865_c0_g1_i1:40-357(+)
MLLNIISISDVILFFVRFFFFKQKTAYEMLRSLVGSEMCIRDRVLDPVNVLGTLLLMTDESKGVSQVHINLCAYFPRTVRYSSPSCPSRDVYRRIGYLAQYTSCT